VCPLRGQSLESRLAAQRSVSQTQGPQYGNHRSRRRRLPTGGFLLDERRPVWAALSEMFLDTEVAPRREDIAKTLAESPYSIAELQSILVDEVYPVCRGNIFVWPGGEWAAFDPVWLETRILRRLRSPFRALHRFNLGRVSIYASSDWRHIKRMVSGQRGPRPSAQWAG
jgi:hypothetical protein